MKRLKKMNQNINSMDKNVLIKKLMVRQEAEARKKRVDSEEDDL